MAPKEQDLWSEQSHQAKATRQVIGQKAVERGWRSQKGAAEGTGSAGESTGAGQGGGRLRSPVSVQEEMCGEGKKKGKERKTENRRKR